MAAVPHVLGLVKFFGNSYYLLAKACINTAVLYTPWMFHNMYTFRRRSHIIL